MTAGLVLALVLSLSSAFALNWGFFTQRGAAAELPRLSLRRPLASLRLLFGEPRWLAGFLVGVAGWGLYVAALALAPLSLVQSTSAGGIGILALLVWFGGDERLTRAQWLAAGLALVGLVLLGVSLHGPVSSGPPTLPALAGWIGASAALAALLAGPLGRLLSAGAGLGVAAGVLYAAGDVATKAATARSLWFVPAVLAAHGLAFVCLQLGFQRGGTMTTAGLSTLFTNALPIVAGIVLFAEHLPGGALGVLRLAAFALVTAGAALLAWGAESPTPNPAQPRPERAWPPPAGSAAG